MLEHRTCDALPLRGSRGHVAAIGHVAAATGLVGAQEVRAEHAPTLLRDESLVRLVVPVGKRVLPAEVGRQRVGLARAQDRLDDRPDRIAIFDSRGTDGQHGRLTSSLYLHRTAAGRTRSAVTPADAGSRAASE